MSLSDWASNGWLVEHGATASEISALLSVSDRDFADSQIEGLSADARMSIAYNSALQAATAALVACGYRAARGGQHYRVIQSLSLTVGAEPNTVAQLDRFRKKRNISDYERAGSVSDQEAKEMLGLAAEIRALVTAQLKKEHPELLDS
jgi:hypothetical protein